MESLLVVHRKVWAKAGGLDMKVVDRVTFVFYFEEPAKLESVLKRALCSFGNSLLAIERLSPWYASF